MVKTDIHQLVTRVSSNIAPPTAPALTPEQAKLRSEQAYREHLFQTFQALKFVRTMQAVEPAQLIAKTVNLPKRRGYENKKTVIFDLDETLVHCVDDIEVSCPDVVLPVTFPTGEVISAGLNIRPFVREVLEEANKHFEVLVFTASHKCYADVVLDYIDPTKELIHHRLYRDNCVSIQGVFIKDLRIFANRRLQDLVIVDNAAYSFGNQIDNGIPIISWHDDRNDRELFNLQDYLKLLAQSHDVREVNNRTFHLQTFYDDYIEEFLTVKKLSSPKRTRRS
jgi:CTD small phosphatase-like protein 2